MAALKNGQRRDHVVMLKGLKTTFLSLGQEHAGSSDGIERTRGLGLENALDFVMGGKLSKQKADELGKLISWMRSEDILDDIRGKANNGRKFNFVYDDEQFSKIGTFLQDYSFGRRREAYRALIAIQYGLAKKPVAPEGNATGLNDDFNHVRTELSKLKGSGKAA